MYLKQKRLISGQRLIDNSACYGLSITAFSGYGTVSDSSISLKRYLKPTMAATAVQTFLTVIMRQTRNHSSVVV